MIDVKPSRYVDTHMNQLISDLQMLIRQPSVSAQNHGIEECAKLVADLLTKSGISSEILRLKKGVAPIVFGHVKSKQNPSKTLLFYNHYDVQPAEPFELWDYPPFSGTRKGNKIFGRGSTDDKGELITRIKAVSSYLQCTGDVPCNIKFVIEGEEETGSAHIEQYLKRYKNKFSCDGVIWEFGYVDAKDRPIIGLGMKGLLFVELSVKESNIDVHSSLAVLIKNPAWRLIDALRTLCDTDGKILIPDWYKDVVPLSKNDLALIQSEPFDEDMFKKEFGIKSFLGGKRGLDAKKALVGDATCNIAGFVSGYTGDGAKTVLPSRALVKIDFRLVPNMNPKKQVLRLKRHLKSKGFGDVKVKVFNGEAAAKIDSSDPFVSHVQDAANRSFGDSILNVSNAGTGPMHPFANILNAPCICIGSTYMFAKIHSPNEFARVDLLKKTAKCMCLIMENFAGNNA